MMATYIVSAGNNAFLSLQTGANRFNPTASDRNLPAKTGIGYAVSFQVKRGVGLITDNLSRRHGRATENRLGPLFPTTRKYRFSLFRQRPDHDIPEINNTPGIMALQGKSSAGDYPQGIIFPFLQNIVRFSIIHHRFPI